MELIIVSEHMVVYVAQECFDDISDRFCVGFVAKRTRSGPLG